MAELAGEPFSKELTMCEQVRHASAVLGARAGSGFKWWEAEKVGLVLDKANWGLVALTPQLTPQL